MTEQICRDFWTRAKAAPLQALEPSPTSLIPGVVGVDGVPGVGRVRIMLDIRLLREKPDFVRERLATRGGDLSSEIDAILALDTERRQAETELQKRNAERNRLSKEIGQLRAKKLPSAELEAQVRQIGEEISALNTEVSQADEQQKKVAPTSSKLATRRRTDWTERSS